MDRPWYETFFDERYLAVYPALRKQVLAREDARFVAGALGLAAGSTVLDLGCGTGRQVRAYLPHEILVMIDRAGLELSRLWGALCEVPFSWADSPNQVYLCRRR